MRPEKFIRILSNNIIEDGFDCKNEDELATAFKETVADLPKGDLKQALKKNLPSYLDELKRRVQKKQGKVNGTVGKSFPYNLYCKQDTSIDSNISGNKHVLAGLLHQQAHSLPNENLNKLLKHLQGSSGKGFEWKEAVDLLTSVTCGKSAANVLQRLMHVFYGKISEEIIKEGSSKKSKKQLVEVVESLLPFFHLKNHYSAVDFSGHSYEDLLSAILSVYIDLILEINRNADEETRHQCCQMITSKCQYLLHHNEDYLVDMLLQLNNLQEGDTDIILPLCRKALVSVQVEGHIRYTKYVCLVRQLLKTLGKPNIEDIYQFAQSIKAGSGYLKWVKEGNDSLGEEFPETSHFKKRKITCFLLDEASETLMEELLDLTIPADDEEEEEYEAMNGVEESADTLFFVDTARDAQDDAEVKEEDEAPEFTQADVDKALAAMDTASEDEEDEEEKSESEHEVDPTIIQKTEKALKKIKAGAIEEEDSEAEESSDEEKEEEKPIKSKRKTSIDAKKAEEEESEESDDDDEKEEVSDEEKPIESRNKTSVKKNSEEEETSEESDGEEEEESKKTMESEKKRSGGKKVEEEETSGDSESDEEEEEVCDEVSEKPESLKKMNAEKKAEEEDTSGESESDQEESDESDDDSDGEAKVLSQDKTPESDQEENMEEDPTEESHSSQKTGSSPHSGTKQTTPSKSPKRTASQSGNTPTTLHESRELISPDGRRLGSLPALGETPSKRQSIRSPRKGVTEVSPAIKSKSPLSTKLDVAEQEQSPKGQRLQSPRKAESSLTKKSKSPASSVAVEEEEERISPVKVEKRSLRRRTLAVMEEKPVSSPKRNARRKSALPETILKDIDEEKPLSTPKQTARRKSVLPETIPKDDDKEKPVSTPKQTARRKSALPETLSNDIDGEKPAGTPKRTARRKALPEETKPTDVYDFTSDDGEEKFTSIKRKMQARTEAAKKEETIVEESNQGPEEPTSTCINRHVSKLQQKSRRQSMPASLGKTKTLLDTPELAKTNTPSVDLLTSVTALRRSTRIRTNSDASSVQSVQGEEAPLTPRRGRRPRTDSDASSISIMSEVDVQPAAKKMLLSQEETAEVQTPTKRGRRSMAGTPSLAQTSGTPTNRRYSLRHAQNGK